MMPEWEGSNIINREKGQSMSISMRSNAVNFLFKEVLFSFQTILGILPAKDGDFSRQDLTQVKIQPAHRRMSP